MFELDKKKFGAFVSALRKEKGYTQKEMAQKLLISDKAISKWEECNNTYNNKTDIASINDTGQNRDKLLFNWLLPVKQQWTVDSGKWTVVVSPAGMK